MNGPIAPFADIRPEELDLWIRRQADVQIRRPTSLQNVIRARRLATQSELVPGLSAGFWMYWMSGVIATCEVS